MVSPASGREKAEISLDIFKHVFLFVNQIYLPGRRHLVCCYITLVNLPATVAGKDLFTDLILI